MTGTTPLLIAQNPFARSFYGFNCRGSRGSFNQKPGDHPKFRKNALGVKRPFSELSESSGVFSEQLSELEIPFSEYEIPFSEYGLSRLEQYETHNSRSNSRSDSRNCREPARKIFICPCILGAFFQELGWSPRTRFKKGPFYRSWPDLSFRPFQ